MTSTRRLRALLSVLVYPHTGVLRVVTLSIFISHSRVPSSFSSVLSNVSFLSTRGVYKLNK